jgi:hypothetical protein
MSDSIKHECGIAMIRLRKPLQYYYDKYGPTFAVNKMYLLMEKQHNRGQDRAGLRVRAPRQHRGGHHRRGDRRRHRQYRPRNCHRDSDRSGIGRCLERLSQRPQRLKTDPRSFVRQTDLPPSIVRAPVADGVGQLAGGGRSAVPGLIGRSWEGGCLSGVEAGGGRSVPDRRRPRTEWR